VNLSVTTQLLETGSAEAISTLPRLQILDLSNSGVLTAEDCEWLASLPELSQLDVSNSEITDAGIVALASSVSLESFDLRNTAVTDATLMSLARMPRLTALTICQCEVSDVGLQSLWSGGFTELLMPDSPLLTADCLTGIEQASDLESIFVTGSWFNDECLKQIAALPSVKRITTSNRNEISVSRAGYDEIQKMYPEVIIVLGVRID